MSNSTVWRIFTSQCSAGPSWGRKRQTMLIHKQTTSARSPLADRLAISGDCSWNALTVTGKVMITWGFSISARCMMISILYTSMMRIPTWPCADYGVSTSPRRSMISPARIASWRSWTTMLLWNNLRKRKLITFDIWAWWWDPPCCCLPASRWWCWQGKRMLKLRTILMK